MSTFSIQNPDCPECGQRAIGTVEILAGVAVLNIEDDGSAEYAGSTEVCWNGQRTARGEGGGMLLTCADGHEWEMQDMGGDAA